MTRIDAWPRDPDHVVLVWETAAADRIRVLRRLGRRARDASLAVRLIGDDGPDGAVEVSPSASEHVLGARPGRRAVAEVGIRTADGTFVALARSRAVTTAAGAPAADVTVTWVTATQPTIPVERAWSGRRVALTASDVDRPGASEASSS